MRREVTKEIFMFFFLLHDRGKNNVDEFCFFCVFLYGTKEYKLKSLETIIICHAYDGYNAVLMVRNYWQIPCSLSGKISFLSNFCSLLLYMYVCVYTSIDTFLFFKNISKNYTVVYSNYTVVYCVLSKNYIVYTQKLHCVIYCNIKTEHHSTL